MAQSPRNSNSRPQTHLQPVVVVDRRAQRLERQQPVLLDGACLAALERREGLLQDRLLCVCLYGVGACVWVGLSIQGAYACCHKKGKADGAYGP